MRGSAGQRGAARGSAGQRRAPRGLARRCQPSESPHRPGHRAGTESVGYQDLRKSHRAVPHPHPKMSYKVVFVVAALCLAQVFAAEKPAEPVKLEEFIAKAQTAINNMATQFQTTLGVKELPEPQKVADTIIQSGKDLASRISDIVTEISSKPDLGSAFTAAAKRFNTTVEDLQKQVPSVQAKASELQKTLQTNMQALVSETQKLATSYGGPVQSDIKKSLESVLDQVSKVAVDMQKKLKEAIETPTANV